MLRDRARARRRRRSRPPAARSRRCGKSACEGPGRGHGSISLPGANGRRAACRRCRRRTSRDEPVRRRQSAELGAAGRQVGDHLLGDGSAHPGQLARRAATAPLVGTAGIRGLTTKGVARQPSGARRPPSTARRCGRVPRPARTGTVGEAPSASTTRTVPGSILRIRQVALPRRKTSPAIDSMAQSSLTVPTRVSSGSSTTRKSATSGMAPPEVTAVKPGAPPGPEHAVDRSR